MMEMKETSRGFRYYEFIDRYGIKCSLQESSLAEEAAIWLGCDDGNPRVCVPNEGWKSVEVPEGTLMDTRMHLTVEQAKELIPLLKYFVKKGCLPYEKG
jgi:hypothetical protein